jgi:branched-subunit amino acid ABC-type transport system permease component
LSDFLQNSVDGLAAGASYALLALGFTLIFGVLRRANLSYGPAIMFGAYVATWMQQHFHLGLVVLAAVTIAGTVAAGAYVERLCFAPHRKGSAIAARVAPSRFAQPCGPCCIARASACPCAR